MSTHEVTLSKDRLDVINRLTDAGYIVSVENGESGNNHSKILYHISACKTDSVHVCTHEIHLKLRVTISGTSSYGFPVQLWPVDQTFWGELAFGECRIDEIIEYLDSRFKVPVDAHDA